MLRRVGAFLAGVALMGATTAVLLEISLRVAEKLGVFTSTARLTEPGFYRDANPKYGIWHPPNFEYRARSECFDVVYASNSWGMRDRDRSLAADRPRVAVLGDSFVEGIGVASDDRMTDLLEKRTGIPHLNFGTAANFSSVQEWLLYEDLVSRFDHDLVLLFSFPNNDFLENDPERWWQRDRYRPYLRRTNGNKQFELWYPVSFDEAQAAAERQLLWNHVYNRLYVYRFFSWLDSQIRVRLAQGTLGSGTVYSGYLHFTELDLERLFESYRRIRDAAGDRPLVVFTIPRFSDLVYARERGGLHELPQRIAQFAASEDRIEYADLTPMFLEHADATGTELSDYFLPCDGHWNELGNAVAAESVLRVLAGMELPDALANAFQKR